MKQKSIYLKSGVRPESGLVRLAKKCKHLVAPVLVFGGISAAAVYGLRVDQSAPKFRDCARVTGYNNCEVVKYNIPTIGTVGEIWIDGPIDNVDEMQDGNFKFTGECNYRIRENKVDHGIYGSAKRECSIIVRPSFNQELVEGN
jgi:hypothetical protein